MPAVPVPAATIMLLRDGPVAPEVLMVERHAKSELMPALYVFPGGRVEEQDDTLVDRLRAIGSEEAPAALRGVLPDRARSFVVAAIRETFEEAGILLARPRGRRELLGGDPSAVVARHRPDVQARRLSFRELVEIEDLELAADTLLVHARWITPEFMPQRFDTLFFTALAPPGQQAHHDGVEATAHVWIRPEEALEQLRARTRRIIFPTAVNLESLTGCSSAQEAFDASRHRAVVPVLPELVERDGQKRLVIPVEAGYAMTEFALDQLRS
jgi:8-oxo-dGTP pyrophosphatase MutT (NUDIX family)